MAVEESGAAVEGRAIYNKRIRDKLDESYKGKIVVIDINSGDYEIDDDDAAAMFRLLERRPDAYTWAERVGYPVVHRMGFGYTFPGLETGHD